jgi:hypothetical protein
MRWLRQALPLALQELLFGRRQDRATGKRFVSIQRHSAGQQLNCAAAPPSDQSASEGTDLTFKL